jgi:hypothetical protein
MWAQIKRLDPVRIARDPPPRRVSGFVSNENELENQWLEVQIVSHEPAVWHRAMSCNATWLTGTPGFFARSP